MGKQYFEIITTQGDRGDLTKTAASHKAKLNNYIRHGIILDNEAMMKLREDLMPIAFGGQRETKSIECCSQSSSMTLEKDGQMYDFVTVLCCEDEVGEGE